MLYHLIVAPKTETVGEVCDTKAIKESSEAQGEVGDDEQGEKEAEEQQSKAKDANEEEKIEPMDEDVAKEDADESKESIKADDEAPKNSEESAAKMDVTDSGKSEESKAEAEKSEEVLGVVFQFNEEMILFEFNDSVIGEISTDIVRLFNGEKISNKEQIATFVQLGDEIKCQGAYQEDIKEFSYEEEEEEIGEDGEVTRSTRSVSIKPQWSAHAGKILTNNSSEDKGSKQATLRKEDVLVLEDQLETMFDYEPEEDEDDEDVLLIEDVKIDDVEENKAKPKVKPKTKPEPRKAEELEKLEKVRMRGLDATFYVNIIRYQSRSPRPLKSRLSRAATTTHMRPNWFKSASPVAKMIG